MRTLLFHFTKSNFFTKSLVMLLLLFSGLVNGQVSITQFSGGTNISADKAANATSPAYVTSNIVVSEGTVKKALQNGTLILTAPSGWTFNNTGVSVSGVTASVAYTSATVITVTITGGLSNGSTETATINNVGVRAVDGANLPSSGDIILTGTAITFDGSALDGASLGVLSQTFGVMTKLVVTLPGQTFTDGSTVGGSGNTGSATAQTVGTPFNITSLTATDQFFNIVTSFTGSKVIAYSGPGSSSGGSPSYTTTVIFTSGVSTTALATSLRKAETTTITATNGGSFGVASSSFVVNPKALTVSSPVVTSKIYDGTTAAAITGTLSVISSGDNVTFNGTGTFVDKNVGIGKAVTSTSTLSGADAANYTLTQPTGLTGTISARALTITGVANSKTYDGTTSSATNPTVTSGAIQSGDTAAFTQIYNTKNVGAGKTMTPMGVVTDGNSGNNYSYTFVTSTNGTITARALTITGAANSKTYDGTTNSTTNPTVTSGAIQSGDTAAFTQTYDTKNVGAGKTMTPIGVVTDGNSGNNYSYTFVTSANGIITGAPLTITANNASKCFGTTYTLGTTAFTTSALQAGETVGNVTLTSSGAASGATVGGYSIVPSSATGGSFTAGNYTITYNNGTLTVNALPSAPSGTNGTRCSTGTVNLSASVGGGETVDWYNATSGGTLLLSGSTSFTTSSISSTTLYYAEARNTTTGCVSSTRTTVTATVSPTSVGGTVTGGTTICSGSTSGLLTLSGNTGAVVRWESSVSPFSTWSTISNTSSTYTSGVLTQTTKFRAVVQSGSCSEANSADTTVTVDAATAGGSVTGGTAICSGSTSGLLTLSGNTGTIVRWESSVSPFSTWSTISNTSSTYTSGALTQTTKFRAVVKSGSCPEANSADTTVTVDAVSVGGSVTGGATVCSGSTSGLLTLSGNTGAVVRWESSVSPFSTWSTIANTSSTYTSGALTQTTKFRAVVQSGSCSEANSADTTVTVDAATAGGSVTGGAAICSGSNSGLLTLSGNTGTVVRWESSVSPFSTWSTISNTSSTYTSGALTQTTKFRAVVKSGSCPEANSVDTTVTVDAVSVGGSVTGGATVCSGSTSGLLTLSGNTGTVVRWESSVSPFSTWSTISNTSSTYTSGTLTQTTKFRAVVQSGSCSEANSADTTVTVDVATVAGSVTGGTAICAGSTSGLLILSGYTGTIVRWESSVSPFSSWSTIANTSDTYTSGALTQTTRFRAIVQSGSCSEVASAYTSVDINTTTWSSGSWNNGAPNNTTSAIISSSFISGGVNFEACTLTVNNNATVVISSGDTVTLSGALTATPSSLVTFNNNANLIQSGATNTNSGAIIIKRSSSPLMRLDYTLWSSPVAGQQLQAFSPQTLNNRFYTYTTYDAVNPPGPTNNTNLYTAVNPSTTNFATATGYLIRMPNNHPTTATVWTGQFAGVPNNGDYSYALVDGGAGKRFNLVGNPYPSPIDATAFVGDANNTSSITGTLYFWRKTNNVANPSYCTWTSGGFVSNNQPYASDPNDVIQVGQGFFVEGTGSGTVNFNNNMRIDDHANHFFKTAAVERNRVWLNATNAAGMFSQTMVGYMTNATQGVDPTIDGKYINDGGIAFASLIDSTPYAIQGRALPFDAADVVPMYFKADTDGDYTIAIDHTDGLFAADQSVYLKDNTAGIIHDLHTGGYTFSVTAGSYDARFELLYQLPLGYTSPVFSANQVVIYKNTANEFVINTGSALMSKVKVFDVQGRLLLEQKGVNASQTTVNAGSTNEVLLVQITSEEGTTVTKKVIR